MMYVLDPVYGRRRRAHIRDKALHAASVSRVVLGKKARDAGNRVRGVVAGAGARLRCEQVSDDRLAARVRSKLGRAVSRPADIEVTVNEGMVTLRGIVRSQESERLLRCVARVRGVRGVEDQLKLKRRHGDAPETAAGDGNVAHNGRHHSAPARLLAAAAGGALALYGAKRHGPLGAAVSMIGVRMLGRGLDGHGS